MLLAEPDQDKKASPLAQGLVIPSKAPGLAIPGFKKMNSNDIES